MANLNYSKIVKPDSFIGTYMQLMETLETPYAYDFWAAVWLMSVALERNVYVNRPMAPVRLNWYILLIAESGVTRKSTEVKYATDFAKKFYLNWRRDGVAIIESKMTGEYLERFVHELSQKYGRSTIVLSASELARLLGKEKYKSSLPSALVDLYDSPDLRIGGGTVTGGSFTFKNVYLNFLGASAPSWLARSINPDVLEGGFASRVIWVVSEKRKQRVAWPEAPKNKEALESKLLEAMFNLNEEGKTINTINISENALTKFKNWYGTRKESIDSFRASFEAREDDHVLRLAAILSINAGRWLISSSDIIHAIKIVSGIKHQGSSIFVGGANRDKLIQGIDKLRECLVLGGKTPVTQTELYSVSRNYLTNEDFRLLLKIMHEMKLVQRFEDKGHGVGPKTTLWRGTKNLLNSNSVKTILLEFSGD